MLMSRVAKPWRFNFHYINSACRASSRPAQRASGDSMKTGLKKIAVIVGIATLGVAGFSGSAWAQALEKQKVSIAVGGKNLFYYLPLTIAEQQGYFKDEGLQVEISDFAGGAKALQALVGGSADVVSGAYEHTINMQAKGQSITAFV